jgi:hypothetical protein
MLVVFLSVTFDQKRVARSARWDKADRLAVVAERAKYAVLAVFGLTRYVPSWHSLLVESPERCEGLTDIDWGIAWCRDYLMATGTNSENTK